MRSPTFILLTLAAIFNLVSCQDETPVEIYTREKVLVLGNSNEPQGLDPQVVTGVIESSIIRSIFEGLCVEHPSEEGTHLPGAATSWTPNADFSEWTFKLQPNGKWSDGTPLTAHDFVFAYERMLHPEFGAKYASMLYCIKNAEAFNKGEVKDFSQVGAKAVDDHTLQISLRSSIPFLPDLTKHYTWYPVAKHCILKHGTIAQLHTGWTEPENMVSNGAFQLETWKFNDRIEVVRNPYYWDKDTVKLNAIRFLPISNPFTEARMFFNQQLHATYTLSSEMIEYAKQIEPESYRQETYLGTNFIRFNMTREHLKDIRVRKALSLSIDRQIIIDKVLKGGQKPALGMVPPMGSYQSSEIIKFDPIEAKRLLAEAGYNESNQLTITLLTTDKDSAKIQAEAYQDMWKKNLGIQVNIQQREWKTYLTMLSGLDFDIATGGWIGDYPDPTTFLDMWKEGDGNNRTGWGNAQYESLLRSAEKTQDPQARLDLLKEAEELFLNDYAIMPLYWYTSVYMLHPSVKNWHPLLLKNQPYKFLDLK